MLQVKSIAVVHPTFWFKVVCFVLKPFVSSKLWRKVAYVDVLPQLFTMAGADVVGARQPDDATDACVCL